MSVRQYPRDETPKQRHARLRRERQEYMAKLHADGIRARAQADRVNKMITETVEAMEFGGRVLLGLFVMAFGLGWLVGWLC